MSGRLLVRKERHSKTNGGVWTKNQEEVWNTVMLYVGYRDVLWSQSQGECRATCEWMQWPHMKFLKWAKAVVLRMCLWISESCHKAAEVFGTQHCLLNEWMLPVCVMFFLQNHLLPTIMFHNGSTLCLIWHSNNFCLVMVIPHFLTCF